jgi:hypothetical protein
MAKREQYTYQIKCPACLTYGRVQASENENPVHGEGLGFEVEAVSDGFKLESLGRNARESGFTCDRCGAQAA